MDTDEDDLARFRWGINGDELMRMLRRCHAGESPDLVYAEMYVNSDLRQVDELEEDL